MSPKVEHLLLHKHQPLSDFAPTIFTLDYAHDVMNEQINKNENFFARLGSFYYYWVWGVDL